MSGASVVLVSGGLDSAVALHRTAAVHPGRLYALTVEYGQRHWQEIDAARRIVRTLDVDKHAIVNVALANVARGRLVSRDVNGPPIDALSAVVPGRNTVLLALAASFASSVAADRIVIGACAADAEVFVDCRPAFMLAAQHMFASALESPVSVEAPFLLDTKQQIVNHARDLGEACWRAVGLSWSCYQPQVADGERCNTGTPCGLCGACAARKAGFEAAGLADPAVTS